MAPSERPPSTKPVPSYRPQPAASTVFKSAEPLVHGFTLNPLEISTVFAYLEDPAQANRIREVVMRESPTIGFQNIESPALFATMREDRPLVIFVDDRTIYGISREVIKNNCPRATIVLLSSNELVCTTPLQHAANSYPSVAKADLVAATIGASGLEFEKTVGAFIRLSEDLMNIERSALDALAYPQGEARRFIVLVVDDEARWFAEFLPQLYSIIGHRADIMIKRTYEDAKSFLEARGDDVICLISDMSFPKDGTVSEAAGRSLVSYTRDRYPRIATAIATRGKLPEDLASESLLLPKGSHGSIGALREFIKNYAGFGDFIIPVNGERKRVRTITELQEAIRMTDAKTLEEYASKDFFSTWLYMHGYYVAANKIRPDRSRGERLRILLLTGIEDEADALRQEPFIIRGEGEKEICRTYSLLKIASHIERLPAEMIEKWESGDWLSFWLMRHGYPELADELRPIQGPGAEIRERVISTMRKWIEEYGRRGVQVDAKEATF